MSDEPKERSSAWLCWIAFLTPLVLYPLSMGPVCWFAPDSSLETAEKVYAPISWLRSKSEAVDHAVLWYLRLRD